MAAMQLKLQQTQKAAPQIRTPCFTVLPARLLHLDTQRAPKHGNKHQSAIPGNFNKMAFHL